MGMQTPTFPIGQKVKVPYAGGMGIGLVAEHCGPVGKGGEYLYRIHSHHGPQEELTNLLRSESELAPVTEAEAHPRSTARGRPIT